MFARKLAAKAYLYISVVPVPLLCGANPAEFFEKFETTWDQGENALLRAYTKGLKDGKGVRIRTEGQEYPNKRFDEAMDEKLSVVGA